ncbi:phytanoyl-CoA dioxygenase family protein [Hyphomonas sp.]|uniref:phytanoyl-CoA dioxygenase family protein n=1 Tax=Hyphomonas sp. TaxID=87 RepID=UPI0025B9C463|nr:phytanoyl-CoA dioxygenase family protein [Hyphomonas sp.]
MIDRRDFEDTGRAWIRNAIPPGDLIKLANGFQTKGRAGDRPAFDSPVSEYFLGPNPVSGIAGSLGLDPVPVRLAVFNKTDAFNWSVPWHQDRVIAVSAHHELPDHKAWLPKDGYWHVEPPVSILERMIFVRLHIDAADETNGCLQLALGSYKAGRVPAGEAAAFAESCPIESCPAQSGDLLVVKALTLHRSSSSRSAMQRRAVRVDYADRSALNAPLRWALDVA